MKNPMWRFDEDDHLPVQVDCPDGLFPNSDSEGRKIWDNTHFKTEDEAWKKGKSEVLATVRHAGRCLENSKAKVRCDEIQAANAAERFKRFSEAAEAAGFEI